MRLSGAATVALGTLAVAAGAAFLWDVGALAGMATRNLAAFAAGLLAGWVAHRFAKLRYGAQIMFAAAAMVLAAVLLIGIEMQGVTRWLALGPLTVQPGLILAPLILAIAGSREGRHWRAAALLPLALIAVQPDAATLAATAAGVATMMANVSNRARLGWTRRRIAVAASALALAVLGLLATGIQTPPPVAFVEGTVGIAALSGSFAVALHALAIGLALGALSVSGRSEGPPLAAYYAVAAVAAAFWAFPMPIAGASPSHLAGFGLAIGWVATAGRGRVSAAT